MNKLKLTLIFLLFFAFECLVSKAETMELEAQPFEVALVWGACWPLWFRGNEINLFYWL